jgi:hypothetical protein
VRNRDDSVRELDRAYGAVVRAFLDHNADNPRLDAKVDELVDRALPLAAGAAVRALAAGWLTISELSAEAVSEPAHEPDDSDGETLLLLNLITCLNDAKRTRYAEVLAAFDAAVRLLTWPS